MVTTRPIAKRDGERRAEPRGPERGQHREDGDGDEQLDAVEHAPAERAEQPLPEEQAQADQEQERDEDEAGRRDAAERERPQDLALDLVGLGPREVDVGADDADRGGRAVGRELREAGRRAPRRAGRALSGLGRSGSSGRPPRWLGVSFGRPPEIIAAPDGPTRRVRSHHGRCERVATAARDARPRSSPRSSWRVGTELTVGETTDTNSGELARSLVAHGVTVLRISNLPDDLAVVVDALRTALARADLVVTTGGLGPTPDDLTREAVAEACGETPVEDEATLAWLRGLWARRAPAVPRGQPQAGVDDPVGDDPRRTPTARRPAGGSSGPTAGSIVTLPGPPREMRPMWTDEVLPRLAARGVGVETEVADAPPDRDRRVAGRRAAR